jgi:hypothetical protein
LAHCETIAGFSSFSLNIGRLLCVGDGRHIALCKRSLPRVLGSANLSTTRRALLRRFLWRTQNQIW